MRIQDEQKVQQCALANTEASLTLATAGTLCMYAGSDKIGAGINLFVESVVAAQLVQAYNNLIGEPQQEDMYNVAMTEPIRLQLTPTEIDFEIVLQDLSRHLLYLHSALCNLQLSYARYQAARQTLDVLYQSPQSSIFQDAHTFATLQKQSIWRHLMLCAHLHTDILMSASRVNLLWHKFKQQLPNQNVFSSHEILEMLTTVWRENAKEIAEYKLPAFSIHNPSALLNLFSTQTQLQRPTLLLDGNWHKSMSQLEQIYQQTLEAFYQDE
ncbi:hypothetical protein [Dictyobacter aurantiacus]|uniref:Uncharacterized protein n=1 Tax=Dictyobacter aurantiacus TaxID=1936993 RepID=A0A401ZER3_9CHLR|nr:hypothetical protein [Dictyobacter aurantiacus]GCE05371.1 hypothetical protein KDAU_27000 [Dictyobacter aurantiacus]